MVQKSDLASAIEQLRAQLRETHSSLTHLYAIVGVDPRKARWMAEYGHRTKLPQRVAYGDNWQGVQAPDEYRRRDRPNESPPWETCDIAPLTCMYHDPPEDRDCPRTPHDHHGCTYRRGHVEDGGARFHSWNLYGDDSRAVTDPHAPKPVIYEIPLPPPVGRTVVSTTRPGSDARYWRWKLQPDGDLVNDAGRREPWLEVLFAYGPLELAELTDDERASEALYGPVGMRWADPDGPPCPYNEHAGIPRGDQPVEYRSCAFRVGHGGGHKDIDGNVLGENSTIDEKTPLSVSPQQAAEVLCTCGRPDQHQPGCPRHERMRHTSGEPK